jgi:hypothetical protein
MSEVPLYSAVSYVGNQCNRNETPLGQREAAEAKARRTGETKDTVH